MRIALFGGSFDPPHRGHVALTRLAIARMHLDQVLIAPVGTQPLKQDAVGASFEDRMAMTQLAFAGELRTEVSGFDAPRPDGRPNYTIETILDLKSTLGPDKELFCLMGADSWLTIGKWHRAQELLMACDFIVGARPGFERFRTPNALPAGIRVTNEPECMAGCTQWTLHGPSGGCTRLYLLADLAEDVSATELRSALSGNSGVEPETVLNPEVANYIRAHKLYGIDV
jgi:nicotinate-nucleotide adenylyltransferase